MHPQPIGDPDHADAVVLDLLLVEHAGIWTIDELKDQVGNTADVEDALARLRALRLVHQIDDCVFATRAAAHVHKLAG